MSEINNGMFAGNVCTASGSHIAGTVGMDCSGYVSVAFDLPYKHGTGGLLNCFTQVDEDNIQAYDILNDPYNHVIIITNVYYNAGVRYINTYEMSRGAGKIKVTTGRNPEDLFDDGYVPMRYNYLE